MECKKEQNMLHCNCTYDPCSKKGVCCTCMQSHWRSGEFPACFFPPDVEKTYDRSIEQFIKTYQKRGKWW
jgi:hypothetical protein